MFACYLPIGVWIFITGPSAEKLFISFSVLMWLYPIVDLSFGSLDLRFKFKHILLVVFKEFECIDVVFF